MSGRTAVCKKFSESVLTSVGVRSVVFESAPESVTVGRITVVEEET